MIKITKTVLTLSCLYSLQIFALDTSTCRIEKVSALDKLNVALQSISKTVEPEWWSATEEMIINRKCKEKLPTLEEIENEINLKSDSKFKTSTSKQNVNFEDENPDLIKSFRKLTIAIGPTGEELPSEDVQAKYNINPECKKVKCAVEKIFGKELGNKLLYINLKYGFNSSELAFSRSSRLKIEEVNSLISAMQSFPISRFPLSKNKKLTKYTRDPEYRPGGAETYANATTSFFDGWTAQTPAMREYTAVHEMGHYIGTELKADYDPKWLELSGWVKKDKEWINTAPNSFTSEYGSGKPSEDFAESVSAYRFNPAALKKASPEKYQYIKETVFDGLEYFEEAQCQNSKSNTETLAKQIAPSNTIRTPDELKNLLKPCAEETKDYLLDEKTYDEKITACLNRTKNINSLMLAVDTIKPQLKYPEMVKENLRRMQNNSLVNKDKEPDDFQDAKAYLKTSLINNIYDWDSDKGYIYNSTKENSEICKNVWPDYGYSAIFKGDEVMTENMNIYTDKEKFNEFLINLCEKINKGKTKYVPVTKIEIENALKN
jgi:hypothetical protein